MRNPPVMISVIGFFAALAGFGWFFFGLSLLGFDWFGVLGDLPAFEQANRINAWGTYLRMEQEALGTAKP